MMFLLSFVKSLSAADHVANSRTAYLSLRQFVE